jgi:hypothetical protein
MGPSSFLDLPRQLAQPVDPARGNRDLGAGARQDHREPPAQAARRAGHDRDLVGEIEEIGIGHGAVLLNYCHAPLDASP